MTPKADSTTETFELKRWGREWDTYVWTAFFATRPMGHQWCFQYHGSGWRARRHSTRELAEQCGREVLAGKKRHRTEKP